VKHTIRTQLLIVNTIALLIVFVSMSAYLITTNSRTLRDRLKNEVHSFSALATPPIGDAYGIYGESGTKKIKDTIKAYLEENESVTNATIVNLQGKPLFSFNQQQAVTISADQAGTFEPIFVEDGQDLTQVIYPYFGASGAHSYSVVYSVSNEAINAAVRHETISLLVFTILSLLVTSAVTFIAISYIILRPVRKVSQQAEVISRGNLEQQIEVEGNNEIAALGSAVNAMAESLKSSIAKLQEIDKVKSEFMAITSHNLRTPLTIINGYLENIDILNTVEDLKKAMNRIATSVARLEGFAEDVLTISRFELGEGEAAKDKVNIDEFMEKIASETMISAEMHELKFTANISTGGATVLMSKPHLRSAVVNIIDNAIKFTPKKGEVALVVSRTDNIVRIAVTDTGIGISKEEIPKLFTKFHRGTSVTTYDYEGTGIGLYATKIIVEEAGGTITVETEQNKGSTFTINLPVATNAK
jgi:signal transduction histidine kinase